MAAQSLNPGKAKAGATPPGTQTKVMSCACAHEFQDERLGRGKRVFNRNKNGWSCTVCGRSISA